MARGKYASSAEARRARESAESEVVAGRRTIARLSAENADLHETLARERAENTERLRRYAALMEEGSSPEVESLRAKLIEERAARESEREERALTVWRLLKSEGVSIDLDRRVDIRLAEALGVQVGVMSGASQRAARRDRRATNKQANYAQNIREWARAGCEGTP